MPAASKTARRSMPAAAAKGGIQLGNARLIIPLNGGRNAYVRTPGGKMPNLRTDTEKFAEQVAELAGAGLAAQLRNEFDALAAAHPGDGWAATKARLEEAGAFGA